MNHDFHDHFSGHASAYANARPGYPDALFKYLFELTGEHQLAWDCATGNGQAAIGLVNYFQCVIATDASAEQLAAAIQHERIQYRCGEAAENLLDEKSVDLVTIAQALHWFDLGKFYAQVNRVVKPGGIIATWTYAEHQVDAGGVIDGIVADYYVNILADFWPLGREQVENRYQELEFPFPRIETPAFPLQVQWSAEQHWAYLMSWSATQRFINENVMASEKQQRRVYLQHLKNKLHESWGETVLRRVSWPLTLLVGTVN